MYYIRFYNDKMAGQTPEIKNKNKIEKYKKIMEKKHPDFTFIIEKKGKTKF